MNIIPPVVKNLMNSEKAVVCGLLVIAATVLVFAGKITAVAWMNYTLPLAGIYVGGKTAQGVAAMFAGKEPSALLAVAKLIGGVASGAAATTTVTETNTASATASPVASLVAVAASDPPAT